MVLAGGHLAIALVRVPTDVVSKRCARIAEFHARGAVRFHLDTKQMQGAQAVERLLQYTREDAVVLQRGAYSGALEFVPPLLWPRLVCAEFWPHACPPGEEHDARERRLARLPFDGGDKVAVLFCEPEVRGQVQHMRVEPR